MRFINRWSFDMVLWRRINRVMEIMSAKKRLSEYRWCFSEYGNVRCFNEHSNSCESGCINMTQLPELHVLWRVWRLPTALLFTLLPTLQLPGFDWNEKETCMTVCWWDSIFLFLSTVAAQVHHSMAEHRGVSQLLSVAAARQPPDATQAEAAPVSTGAEHPAQESPGQTT